MKMTKQLKQIIPRHVSTNNAINEIKLEKFSYLEEMKPKDYMNRIMKLFIECILIQ